MFDYYSHVHSLKEDKLYEEIQKLNKKLGKVAVGTPMYNQLIDMINMAQSALHDIYASSRLKNAKDTVIDIGEMESSVTQPDYSDDQVLNILVQSYTHKVDDK